MCSECTPALTASLLRFWRGLRLEPPGQDDPDAQRAQRNPQKLVPVEERNAGNRRFGPVVETDPDHGQM